MNIADLASAPGRRFPAGRLSQRLVGPGLPIAADGFCLGHVILDPSGGQVPWHCHPNEEIYMVLEGEAEIVVSQDVQTLSAGQVVYIPGGEYHQLTNRSNRAVRFLYCYSPSGDVDHWRQELDGTLARAGVDAPCLPSGAAPQFSGGESE